MHTSQAQMPEGNGQQAVSSLFMYTYVRAPIWNALDVPPDCMGLGLVVIPWLSYPFGTRHFEAVLSYLGI